MEALSRGRRSAKSSEIPVRIRRRQSDARWRANVASCFETLKNIIPVNKRASKRQISKAYILQETSKHIDFLEEVLCTLFKEQGQDEESDHTYEEKFEDIKTEFIEDQKQKIAALNNERKYKRNKYKIYISEHLAYGNEEKVGSTVSSKKNTNCCGSFPCCSSLAKGKHMKHATKRTRVKDSAYINEHALLPSCPLKHVLRDQAPVSEDAAFHPETYTRRKPKGRGKRLNGPRAGKKADLKTRGPRNTQGGNSSGRKSVCNGAHMTVINPVMPATNTTSPTLSSEGRGSGEVKVPMGGGVSHRCQLPGEGGEPLLYQPSPRSWPPAAPPAGSEGYYSTTAWSSRADSYEESTSRSPFQKENSPSYVPVRTPAKTGIYKFSTPVSNRGGILPGLLMKPMTSDEQVPTQIPSSYDCTPVKQDIDATSGECFTPVTLPFDLLATPTDNSPHTPEQTTAMVHQHCTWNEQKRLQCDEDISSDEEDIQKNSKFWGLQSQALQHRNSKQTNPSRHRHESVTVDCKDCISPSKRSDLSLKCRRTLNMSVDVSNRTAEIKECQSTQASLDDFDRYYEQLKESMADSDSTGRLSDDLGALNADEENEPVVWELVGQVAPLDQHYMGDGGSVGEEGMEEQNGHVLHDIVPGSGDLSSVAATSLETLQIVKTVSLKDLCAMDDAWQVVPDVQPFHVVDSLDTQQVPSLHQVDPVSSERDTLHQVEPATSEVTVVSQVEPVTSQVNTLGQVEPVSTEVNTQCQLEPITVEVNTRCQLEPVSGEVSAQCQLEPVAMEVNMQCQPEPVRTEVNTLGQVEPIRTEVNTLGQVEPISTDSNNVHQVGPVPSEVNTQEFSTYTRNLSQSWRDHVLQGNTDMHVPSTVAPTIVGHVEKCSKVIPHRRQYVTFRVSRDAKATVNTDENEATGDIHRHCHYVAGTCSRLVGCSRNPSNFIDVMSIKLEELQPQGSWSIQKEKSWDLPEQAVSDTVSDINQLVQPSSSEVDDIASPVPSASDDMDNINSPVQPGTDNVNDTDRLVQAASDNMDNIESPVQPASDDADNVKQPVQPALDSVCDIDLPVQTASDGTDNVKQPVQPALDSVCNIDSPVQTASDGTDNVKQPMQPALDSVCDINSPVQATSDGTDDVDQLVSLEVEELSVPMDTEISHTFWNISQSSADAWSREIEWLQSEQLAM